MSVDWDLGEKCARLTGPVLVFLTGFQLPDRVSLAVQAILSADEGEASDAVGGRRRIRPEVVAASSIYVQQVSMLANI